jgi:hypothetical protein
MLFRERTDVCCENNKKHINASVEKNAEVLIVKAGGAYSYHYDLKQKFSNFSGLLPPFFP